MAIQQFDTEKAESTARYIRQQGGTALSAIEKVKKEINQMTVWWKGETSEAFNQQFRELEPSLKKLGELVNQIGDQLDSVRAAKLDSEQQIARKIK